MLLCQIDLFLNVSNRTLTGYDGNIDDDIVYSIASKDMRFAEFIAQLIQPITIIGLSPDKDCGVALQADGSEIYRILRHVTSYLAPKKTARSPRVPAACGVAFQLAE